MGAGGAGGSGTKAARGHLRRGLPVGLVWGEADGQIGFHPDEAVTGVIGAVFEQFAVCGSVRGVWLWLRDQGLRWPLQGAYRRGQDAEITWVAPTYHAVHTTLTNPAYAGAYTYGRTRSERYLDSRGVLRSRRREMPRDQWEVLITGHHEGWVTWQTYLANQQRIAGNTRPQAHQPARCGKAALSCRAWPAAGSAAAGSPCSTTGRPNPLPATFAPERGPARSARAEHGTCASAVRRSTRP